MGKALRTLIQKYGYSREEFFVCSKGGFVPEDADEGVPGRVIVGELIDKSEGKLTAEDFIKGDLHSIHPIFLEDQLN